MAAAHLFRRISFYTGIHLIKIYQKISKIDSKKKKHRKTLQKTIKIHTKKKAPAADFPGKFKGFKNKKEKTGAPYGTPWGPHTDLGPPWGPTWGPRGQGGK